MDIELTIVRNPPKRVLKQLPTRHQFTDKDIVQVVGWVCEDAVFGRQFTDRAIFLVEFTNGHYWVNRAGSLTLLFKYDAPSGTWRNTLTGETVPHLIIP